MHDIEKILFPKEASKSADITVSYFLLNKDIKLDEENVVYKDTKVIGVGFCEKTNMINVCFNETKSKKYFWVNSNDVGDPIVTQEKWKLKDVKLHNKAIKEKWATEKIIKKD